MEYDEIIEESTEESVEMESAEESVEEESTEESFEEESTEELVEEESTESSIVVDYDRLEQIVSDNSHQAAEYDTELNNLPVSDVLLLVIALLLGILCVKGRN